jgi:hypothetical protein
VAVFAAVGLFSNQVEASVKPMPKQEEANKLFIDNGKSQDNRLSIINKKDECVPVKNTTITIDFIPLPYGGNLVCIDIDTWSLNSDCSSSYSWETVCF